MICERPLLKVYRWNPVVLIALLSSGAALGSSGYGREEKRWAAMQSAVNNAQSAGDNAWIAGQRRAGADDDRPWAWRCFTVVGTQEERAGHHDAELHSDGNGYRAGGRWWVYSLALRKKGTRSLAVFQHLFLRGVGAAPNADLRAHHFRSRRFMIYQLMFAIITPALNLRRIRRAHEIQRHACCS